MSQWKRDIKELEKLFHQIDQALHAYKDPAVFQQKKSQLDSIEQTILRMKKREVPIPSDLRNLKLNLIHEIEDIQEAKLATKEMLALCKKFIEDHKTKRSRSRSSGQLSLFTPDQLNKR